MQLALKEAQVLLDPRDSMGHQDLKEQLVLLDLRAFPDR